MDKLPENTHVVVTGGGRGIGAAIAERLAQLGGRLTLMGRTAETLEARTAHIPGSRFQRMDVTDESSVESAFAEAREKFGPVGILVNNAGAVISGPLERMDSAAWRTMLDVNLFGIFLCTRQVIPDMHSAGWGRIINIASTAGLKGYPYVSAYCAAKHGAVGLTRSLALETARTGITVNALCPGYAETDLLEGALQAITEKTGMGRNQAEDRLKAANPQGRFIQPEEVAAATAWLCLPGSESITGQAIAIAGGEVM